jgi:hypothetical protein
VALWLALVPYQHRLSIGLLPLSGRCPAALTAAFTRAPGNAFYDLGPGGDLPAELCAPSARRRAAGATALCLFAGAVFIAGRTTWRPRRQEHL